MTVVRDSSRLSIRSEDDALDRSQTRAAEGSYSVRFPAVPLVLSAATRHRAAGFKFLFLSLLAFAAAGFLIYELPNTPTLRMEMMIVISICIILGVAMIHWSVRSLLGRLRIDAGGMRWTPGYCGFVVPWKDLRHWSVDSIAFHFRSRKSRSSVTIDRDLLTIDDQNRLQEVLSACIGDRELSSGVIVKVQ